MEQEIAWLKKTVPNLGEDWLPNSPGEDLQISYPEGFSPTSIPPTFSCWGAQGDMNGGGAQTHMCN